MAKVGIQCERWKGKIENFFGFSCELLTMQTSKTFSVNSSLVELFNFVIQVNLQCILKLTYTCMISLNFFRIFQNSFHFFYPVLCKIWTLSQTQKDSHDLQPLQKPLKKWNFCIVLIHTKGKLSANHKLLQATCLKWFVITHIF